MRHEQHCPISNSVHISNRLQVPFAFEGIQAFRLFITMMSYGNGDYDCRLTFELYFRIIVGNYGFGWSFQDDLELALREIEPLQVGTQDGQRLRVFDRLHHTPQQLAWSFSEQFRELFYAGEAEVDGTEYKEIKLKIFKVKTLDCTIFRPCLPRSRLPVGP
jgi:hypothetical protein